MSQFKPLSWVLVTALLIAANVPGFALELEMIIYTSVDLQL